MTYKEFTDAEYSDLRKRLIKEKGSALQKEFLNILKDSDQFIPWVEGQITIKSGKDFDLVSDNLSESEFKDSPVSIEKELFDKWEDITPAQACRSTFWGYMTLQHIKEKKIHSHYLAANGGTLPSGLERIDGVLDSGEAVKIDGIVRTAIRRLSGLPEARGNRTVYVDCPFARAWWRGYITQEVYNITSANPKEVIEVLRVKQNYWEELINCAVSRNSVFGDTNIRAALIWALSDLLDDKSKKTLFEADTLKKVIKQVGVRLAWQELAVFSPDKLKTLFEKEFLLI